MVRVQLELRDNAHLNMLEEKISTAGIGLWRFQMTNMMVETKKQLCYNQCQTVSNHFCCKTWWLVTNRTGAATGLYMAARSAARPPQGKPTAGLRSRRPHPCVTVNFRVGFVKISPPKKLEHAGTISTEFWMHFTWCWFRFLRHRLSGPPEAFTEVSKQVPNDSGIFPPWQVGST